MSLPITSTKKMIQTRQTKATFPSTRSKNTGGHTSSISQLWNQGLVNLNFDDNKTRFGINVSSWVWLGKMISKVAITKTNQVKRKPRKRRPPQIEELSRFWVRSFCKVIGTIGSCILFLFKHLKSSKSWIALKSFIFEWFHVFN